DRAGRDARDGGLPGHRRDRAHREPGRAQPRRPPRARRRELAAPHPCLLRRRRGQARLSAGHDHRVRARGPYLLGAFVEVTLKIERYNPDTDEQRLESHTVDVVETATLLDVLDTIKDEVDGSLTFRKSCRMAVCGSCGMRMDGAAVLACKTPMAPLAEQGRMPVISPMGNLPVVKDLVVDMEPFWAKFRAVKPWLEEDDHPPLKEWRVQQAE